VKIKSATEKKNIKKMLLNITILQVAQEPLLFDQYYYEQKKRIRIKFKKGKKKNWETINKFNNGKCRCFF